jgi:hypothetical protein
VRGGDSGRRHAEHDTDSGDRGAVEEDADEEAEGDETAGEEDAQGGLGVEEYEGGADGKGKDEPSSDLVERGVDVFEGVVAETSGGLVRV